MNRRIAVSVIALAVLASVPARSAETRDAKPARTAATPAAAVDPVRAKALEEGWPDTPAGLMAYDWIEAFSSGDRAMQAFYEKHLSKETLAKKSMSERLSVYRNAREKLGALSLASIEDSNPTELTASLLAEDATQHKFVFKCEAQAPYYLVSVSTFETHYGHGGHGH